MEEAALAAAFRAGKNTVRDGERGTLRWEDWLRDSAAGKAASRRSSP